MMDDGWHVAFIPRQRNPRNRTDEELADGAMLIQTGGLLYVFEGENLEAALEIIRKRIIAKAEDDARQ